ncbi:hypothetical protein HZB02_02245 [Candidatus Woesearchaeota archaeon]|nr:hypothetical protein [Candidatus Woesearchaeota archaeon]
MWGKKRGQITLFIILGIILLLLIGLLLYIIQPKTQAAVVPPLGYQPKPVIAYVEQCVEQTMERGIVLMGMQGGYLTIPSQISQHPPAYVKGDPLGISKVPLWYYEGRDRRPTLQGMQQDLAQFVDREIGGCLQNLTALNQSYAIRLLSVPSASVIIGEESVGAVLTYEMDVTEKGDQSKHTTLTEFPVTIPVKLKRMHDFAVQVLDAENDGKFLENMTVDFMAMDPDFPLTGFQLKCERLTWSLADLKKKLQTIMYYNLPRVRLASSDYQPFLYSDDVYKPFTQFKLADLEQGHYPKGNPPEDLYEYTHFVWNTGDKPYKDLTASIVYFDDWGMDMKARPSNNGVLKSNMGGGPKQFLHFLCLNLYHFTYDIRYPVEVIIYDNTSFQGKGFIFRYAFPVMIDHNEGMRDTFKATQLLDPVQDASFCEQQTNEVYTLIPKGLYGELANMALPDVNISYECIKYLCPLGTTTLDQGKIELRTTFPKQCQNGILTAVKEGYLPAQVQATGQREITLPMKKLKRLSFSVVKHPNGAAEQKAIEDGDTVIISLTSKDPALEFEWYRSLPLEDSQDPTLTSVDFLDEDHAYDLSIFLLKNGEIVGGYVNHNYPLGYAEMQGKSTAVFHAYEQVPAPASDDDRADVLTKLETDQTVREALRPSFT